MKNTPEDTQSSSNAENVASCSRQIHSTPTKSRIASDRRESVDGEFQHHDGGISFETFLKRAFSVTDAEMEKLKRTVAGYNVHGTEQYKAQEALFKTKASTLKREMYDPYAALGNMVLNHAMQDAPKGSLSAIQVLPYGQSIRGLYAERKPDVLLVPKEDGGIPITKTNFCWKHALWVMDFEKQNQENRTGRSDMFSSNSSSESSVNSVSTTDSTLEMVPSPGKQLASYLAEVMSDSGDRTHVFGAIVAGTKMRLQFYSRSCGVTSDEIDIIQNPVLHAVFLVLVSRQDFKGLGFNTAMGHYNPFNTKDETTLRSHLGWARIENGGDNFKLDPSTFRSKLKKRIYTEYCLVGRGTAVYEVEKPVDSNVELVMKMSYQAKTGRREEDAILIAREVDPKHAPEIYGSLTIEDATPTRALIAACGSSTHCEEKELRIILMRKYEPVSKVKTETEFLIVMFNILIFSHELYSKKSLFHRDIGINNIAFYRDEQKNIIGVLIDFDLAIYPLHDGAEDPTIHQRFGTKPFVAIETLNDESKQPYKHHFVHELESILYTGIWYGVGYRGADCPENKKELDYLATWRKGTWKEVRDAKQTFINKPKEILLLIKDSPLRKFCTELAVVLAERYNAFDVRERWEMRAKKSNPGSSGLPFAEVGMKATAPKPQAPEPPIPSKALLPSFLEGMDIEKEPWICLKDCCQEVPASA